MELEKFEIEAGLKEPVTLLHLSDTHICLADERDNERKNVLAAGRIKSAFGGSNEQIEQWLDEAMAFGREQADLIIHTGDLVDFVSAANLDFLKAKLKTEDVFFAPGNHEFSQYVGEAKEDTAYKMQSFDMVQAASPNDLEFAVRKVGGLRLIALNNGYYFFLPEQVTALKAELAREEMPTILIMHNPIHTGEL
ncbi:MAG: metallophosphoesterase, partial [Lentisphaeria bacterium]|nr:metallophosphoesterase [Lentisphaeria bacterium]